MNKKPYEMTRTEYYSKYPLPDKRTTLTGGLDKHESSVEIALNMGKSVNSMVLRDYPWLMPMGYAWIEHSHDKKWLRFFIKQPDNVLVYRIVQYAFTQDYINRVMSDAY